MAVPGIEEVREEIKKDYPRIGMGYQTGEGKKALRKTARQRLFNWYFHSSQKARNWSPFDFPLHEIRKGHTSAVHTAVEGGCWVESYNPDFFSALAPDIRMDQGMISFQAKWVGEELGHFVSQFEATKELGHRPEGWVDEYVHELRKKKWQLPWAGNARKMNIYTVWQERATWQVYRMMVKFFTGELTHPLMGNAKDPVLEAIYRKLMGDEAAHENFFIHSLLIELDVDPENTFTDLKELLLEIYDVHKHFAMPAADLIPEGDYKIYTDVLAETKIYGKPEHLHHVANHCLEELGLKDQRAFLKALQTLRSVPDPDDSEAMRPTALIDHIDFTKLEGAISGTYAKIQKFEDQRMLNRANALYYYPNPTYQNLAAQAAG